MSVHVWKLVVAIGVALIVYRWAIRSGVTDQPELLGIVAGAATAVGLFTPDRP